MKSLAILKHSVLIGICSVILGTTTIAQAVYRPTVQSGAKWTIKIGQGMNSYKVIDVLITCDTMTFNDKDYLMVNTFPGQGANECGLGGYVREDTLEQKVYFIPVDDQTLTELLVLDYSLEKGDTFYFQDSRGAQVVDTVKWINFQGAMVKAIDFGLLAQETFIEGFGSYTSGVVPLCEGWSQLMEYTLSNCNPINATNVLTSLETISIAPNPVEDQMHISLSENLNNDLPILMELTTIDGKVWYREELRHNEHFVDFKNMPKGILLLRLSSGSQSTVRKVLHY